MPSFSVGGRGFLHNQLLVGLADHQLMTTTSKINAYYRFVKESYKKYKYKAALFHTDGGVWHAAIIACRELGIPTFVCFNGSITECVPKFSNNKYYLNADVYYMHGQYAMDWVASRYESDSEKVLVGQPSFDGYYENEEETICNTFLYNSKTVFSRFGRRFAKTDCLIDRASSAFLSHKLSSIMDLEFLEAFAVYQKEVNPEARLVVSLRPYHTASNADYVNFVHGFGIKNCEVYTYPVRPFRELLPKMEYVVTGASTVAIESIINRKGVVLLPGDSIKYSPYKYTDEWAMNPVNMKPEAIVQGLIDVVGKKDELLEACDKHAPYYNFGDDGKASERLAEDLIGRL